MFDKFKNQYSVRESTVLRVYDLFPNIVVNTEKSKLYPSRITNLLAIPPLRKNDQKR